MYAHACLFLTVEITLIFKITTPMNVYEVILFRRHLKILQYRLISANDTVLLRGIINLTLDRFHVTSSKFQNLNYKTYKAGRYTCFADRCCDFSSKF